MREPILVGVDGSDGSLSALLWATDLASQVDSSLGLLHAYSPWAGWVTAIPPFDPEDYKSALRSELEAWCETVADRGVEHECLLVEREPASALLEESGKLAAGLIVLGAHGHSHWSHHLLGSVTSKVLHHATVPVTVVPVDPAAPDHSDIVVGIDGSEASRRALGWAADLAAATDRRLTAVAVVPAELWHEQPFFGAETDAVSGAERFVAEAAVDRGAEVAVEVPMGDPATELVERGAHAYLLVVGSRGHTSIGEVVFGSVSRTCATRCDRPVVIVPAGTSSDAAGSASGADRE